jgi:hypothetical protein
MDISDPRILEPWLDSSLLGGPSPAGAILFLGTTSGNKPFLAYSLEEREGFLSHLSRTVSAFAEATRAVREDGHVIVIAPPPSTEEGQVLRAAARQMVRTALAEQHFLYLSKPVRVSLLTSPGGREDRDFLRKVADILSGQAATEIEPVPVGPTRP